MDDLTLAYIALGGQAVIIALLLLYLRRLKQHTAAVIELGRIYAADQSKLPPDAEMVA